MDVVLQTLVVALIILAVATGVIIAVTHMMNRSSLPLTHVGPISAMFNLSCTEQVTSYPGLTFTNATGFGGKIILTVHNDLSSDITIDEIAVPTAQGYEIVYPALTYIPPGSVGYVTANSPNWAAAVKGQYASYWVLAAPGDTLRFTGSGLVVTKSGTILSQSGLSINPPPSGYTPPFPTQTEVQLQSSGQSISATLLPGSYATTYIGGQYTNVLVLTEFSSPKPNTAYPGNISTFYVDLDGSGRSGVAYWGNGSLTYFDTSNGQPKTYMTTVSPGSPVCLAINGRSNATFIYVNSTSWMAYGVTNYGVYAGMARLPTTAAVNNKYVYYYYSGYPAYNIPPLYAFLNLSGMTYETFDSNGRVLTKGSLEYVSTYNLYLPYNPSTSSPPAVVDQVSGGSTVYVNVLVPYTIWICWWWWGGWGWWGWWWCWPIQVYIYYSYAVFVPSLPSNTEWSYLIFYDHWIPYSSYDQIPYMNEITLVAGFKNGSIAVWYYPDNSYGSGGTDTFYVLAKGAQVTNPNNGMWTYSNSPTLSSQTVCNTYFTYINGNFYCVDQPTYAGLFKGATTTTPPVSVTSDVPYFGIFNSPEIDIHNLPLNAVVNITAGGQTVTLLGPQAKHVDLLQYFTPCQLVQAMESGGINVTVRVPLGFQFEMLGTVPRMLYVHVEGGGVSAWQQVPVEMGLYCVENATADQYYELVIYPQGQYATVSAFGFGGYSPLGGPPVHGHGRGHGHGGTTPFGSISIGVYSGITIKVSGDYMISLTPSHSYTGGVPEPIEYTDEPNLFGFGGQVITTPVDEVEVLGSGTVYVFTSSGMQEYSGIADISIIADNVTMYGTFGYLGVPP